MAQLTEDLLQEVVSFLGGPLAQESAALSANCEQQRKCLLRKLLTIAVGAGLPTSAVYLDMNGVKARNIQLIDTRQRNSFKENLAPAEDVDIHQNTLDNGLLEDTPKADTCTACSVCTGCDNLFPFENSQLLASDSEDALTWLDAIRLAGCHSLKSKAFVSTENRSVERALTPSPTPTSTTNGTTSTVSHSEGDIPQTQRPQPSAVDAQQYEPMSPDPDSQPPPPPPHDEIYHDIAPPATPPPPEQPQYENGEVALQGSPPVNIADEQQQRPLYDDVGQLHLYKNVPSPDAKPGSSQEIVYDDVGMLNGLPTQGTNAGALYELIDDNSTPSAVL